MNPETRDTPADKPRSTQGKNISLVLGSGGARGLAHIGVIRELEARGYQIKDIAGCSMGALVGGLYAVGKMEDYARWVTGLSRTDILRLLDITTSPGGFISGDKIMHKLSRWIGDWNIQDLPIKYTAVAVDIEREREVWMNEGSLYDAIRASIAIPGVFTPYQCHGRILVDGSVLNPIPVAPSVGRLTDKTFVVDANGAPTDIMPWPKDEPANSEAQGNSWLGRALDKLGLKPTDEAAIKQKFDVLRVLMRSLDTMQAALTRQHLAVFNPDRVIRIPRSLCMIHEFHRAGEIIDTGHKIAGELLDGVEVE